MSEQNGRFLRHNAFARRLSVGPSYLTKLRKEGRAVRDEATGRYDLRHEINAILLAKSGADIEPETAATDGNPEDESTAQVLREINQFVRDLRREQARKLEIQNATALDDLIPLDLVRDTLGDIAGGVNQYLLTIPARVARGDRALEDRVHEEVSNALRHFKAAIIRSAENRVPRVLEEETSNYEED
jgi:phage terminase Nu1 subunit (DNA packaging protein)